MRLDTIAEDMCDLATQLTNNLHETLHAMRDAMAGLPGGQSFEARSARSVLWCWEHEQEVARCHRDDLRCDGETILTNDPTGESAVHFDQARHDRRMLERRIRSAHREITEAFRLVANYRNRELTIDRAGVGRCSDCNHYCTGERGDRLTVYRGTDPVCITCRTRRDRVAS